MLLGDNSFWFSPLAVPVEFKACRNTFFSLMFQPHMGCVCRFVQPVRSREKLSNLWFANDVCRSSREAVAVAVRRR